MAVLKFNFIICTYYYNRAITLEFRPAEFLWFHPVPPKTQFGVKGMYRKLVPSSTTFEKSGFPVFPDPVSGSGFNKKSGEFHAGSGTPIEFQIRCIGTELCSILLCSNHSINSDPVLGFLVSPEEKNPSFSKVLAPYWQLDVKC